MVSHYRRRQSSMKEKVGFEHTYFTASKATGKYSKGQPWRSRQHLSPKCWYPPPRLHDVTTQKITVWTYLYLCWKILSTNYSRFINIGSLMPCIGMEYRMVPEKGQTITNLEWMWEQGLSKEGAENHERYNLASGTCKIKQPRRRRGTIIQNSCSFTIGFCLATRTPFWPCIMLWYCLYSVGYMLRPIFLYSLISQCQTLHFQHLFTSYMHLSGDRTMCPLKRKVFDSRLDQVSWTAKTQKRSENKRTLLLWQYQNAVNLSGVENGSGYVTVICVAQNGINVLFPLIFVM
jgi:hypothetical protein